MNNAGMGWFKTRNIPNHESSTKDTLKSNNAQQIVTGVKARKPGVVHVPQKAVQREHTTLHNGAEHSTQRQRRSVHRGPQERALLVRIGEKRRERQVWFMSYICPFICICCNVVVFLFCSIVMNFKVTEEGVCM